MEFQYPSKKLRILELFAGIGGLHWGLKVAEVPCKVVAAMEINPTVLKIYSHNFSQTNVITKNLQGLTAEDINKLEVDAIVMSPPCQPFCRMGNRLDVEDKRTGPLSHITEVLKDTRFKYIFIENVQGFEDSTARKNLIQVLCERDFKWREFMLTPKTFGVPNSRLRYYLIGKHKDLQWSFTFNNDDTNLLTEIPNCKQIENLKKKYEMKRFSRRKRLKESLSNPNLPNDYEDETEATGTPSFRVGDIMDWNITNEEVDKLKLPLAVMRKYYQAMDIVTPSSTNTCCFTKGYGNYVKGTGSVLKFQEDPTVTKDDNLNNDLMNEFPSLRYFSPKEISRLMSYPEEFQLPPNLSLGQKYKSLGNSVNVYIVAILFSILFSEKND